MDRKEIKEKLTNRKVYVGKHSKEICKSLNNVGFKSKTPENLSNRFPFIYIRDKDYFFGENIEMFNSSETYTEISAEEIISFKISPFNIDDIVFDNEENIIGRITSINVDDEVYCGVICKPDGTISFHCDLYKIGHTNDIFIANEEQRKTFNSMLSFAQELIIND